jgi:dTDP-4-dehydrorhamnose 3,5-epimerase
MSNFKIYKTGISGLMIIEPVIFKDNRGFFLETYNRNAFKKIGLNNSFVQDNHSHSSIGVLRGLHMQKKHPQGKLVRVLKGKVYDVAVDTRKNSDTFGKWYGILLSDENMKMFYIPEGFLHGFLVLSEEADFTYKCTDFYYPEDEDGVVWNDAFLNIKWPITDSKDIILSEKDRQLKSFTQFAKEHYH